MTLIISGIIGVLLGCGAVILSLIVFNKITDRFYFDLVPTIAIYVSTLLIFGMIATVLMIGLFYLLW
jgi:hypothetical protein